MTQSGNYKIQFLNKAKEFVKQFDIDSDNEKEMNILLSYFAGIDTKEAPIKKGLLIRGSIGSGKTLALKIIQQLNKNFAIDNIRDVVANFNISGFDGIEHYIKRLDRVFDDIGAENIGKYYGNDTNVTQELILRRYESFQSKGLITHFTTNLGGNNEIMEAYGERVYDRLREMCTLIVLGNNSKSRRNTYLPIEKKQPEVIEKTPEQIYKQMRTATINAFNLFKDGDKSDCRFYIYDWLNKNKFYEPSLEMKKKSMIEAENELLYELDQQKLIAIPSKVKELVNSFENDKQIKINRAKEWVLIEFFNSLVETETNLIDII